MSLQERREQYWRRRRLENEDVIKHPHWARLGRKAVNIARRIVCAILIPFWRKYRRDAPISLDGISSILVIRNDAIGDLIVTTPLIRKLKAVKPSLRIGVAGSYRNISLLAEDPDIASVYTFSFDKPLALWKELRRARRDGWDMAINTVFVPRTRGAILCRLAVGRGLTATLVRTRPDRYKNLYSLCFPLVTEPYPIPYSEQVCSVLEPVFGIRCSGEEFRPSIRISDATYDRVHQQILAHLQAHNAARVVHVNVEAANERREWGLANIFTFCESLLRERGDTIFLLTSSPFYASEIEREVNAHHEDRIIYFPTHHILELVALVRSSDLVLSPDTSVIHIASAEKKPTIGLYTYKGEWLPYRVPSQVFFPHEGAPVATIAVGPVVEAALRLLPPTGHEGGAVGETALWDQRGSLMG